jgi:cytochrome c-type biogenesis protein CcmI
MAHRVTTTSEYDPDELARLEEQRDFLRRSLADLDRELAAGDLNEADHAALAEDYRRRLDEADDDVTRGRSALPIPRRRMGRIAAAVFLVGLVATGAGFAVAHMAGGRNPGDTVTGTVPQTTTGLLAEAANLYADGKITDSLAVYDQVLKRDPNNVDALAERGLVLVFSGADASRQVLFEQGRLSIEQAVRIKPNDPRSLFYLGVTLTIAGEADGATKALADALANNPSAALKTQIEQFQASRAQGTTTTTKAP